MMGGALPLLCWALLLTLAGALNAAWTGDTIQIAMFAAAVLAITLIALALVLHSPETLRRGAPAPRAAREAFPQASFAVVFTALGVGVLTFGFAFGHFPIYLGAGMIVAGLGRLTLELGAQRRALRQAQAERSELEP